MRSTLSDESNSSPIIWPDDGKEMILIAGGTFLMGSNEKDTHHHPEHSVTVADFYIDRWPVTNAEYKRFVNATDHPIPNYEVSWCETQNYNWNPLTRMYPPGKADHPVVLVAWEDALAYAQWANKRLPTEAEWERTARGFQGSRYPWGDTFILGCCNCQEADLGETSPVGLFSPAGDTPEGVMDMVGNVWEWTSSLFRPYPYLADDGRENQQKSGFRVLRGTSWINKASRTHSLARLDGDFKFYNNVGFRCAVSPE